MYFLYWLNVFSNLSSDLILARAISTTGLSLRYNRMDITEASVSSCTTVPPRALAMFCYSQFSLAWDQSKVPGRFSSVHWPKEHRKQRGARCMRRPCDSIIWDRQIQPREGQMWSQQAAHNTVSGNRSVKLRSSPSKSSLGFIKYKQNISHPFLSEAEGEMTAAFAESNSSADYLAFFFPRFLQSGCICSAFPQHDSLLNKCSFRQDFLRCVCQRTDQQVCG